MSIEPTIATLIADAFNSEPIVDPIPRMVVTQECLTYYELSSVNLSTDDALLPERKIHLSQCARCQRAVRYEMERRAILKDVQKGTREDTSQRGYPSLEPSIPNSIMEIFVRRHFFHEGVPFEAKPIIFDPIGVLTIKLTAEDFPLLAGANRVCIKVLSKGTPLSLCEADVYEGNVMLSLRQEDLPESLKALRLQDGFISVEDLVVEPV